MVIQTGKYRHQSDENFREFLEAVGISRIKRFIINLMKPKYKIKDKGNNTYKIITKVGFGNKSFKFTLGGDPVELDYLHDGTRIKFEFTIEDNKLVQAPVPESPYAFLKIIREFKDDDLILTLLHLPSGTVAKRFFKKQ